MASSSLSPVDLHQRIDQILNTNTDMPDFDLTLFVAQIDVLYAHYHAQLGKKKQIRGRLGELPSPSEAANIVEQVSANVKQIGNEIKEYSGDKHQTSIAVLNAIGNVHWIAVGFLVVGAALKIADTIKSNKEECLRLFKSMIDLSKIILQLQGHPGSKREFHAELNNYIQLIVKGVILCCSQKKRTGCKRVFKASRDKEELIQLRRDIDDMHQMLPLQISTYILKILQSPPPLIPVLDDDIVGIEEKIKDVVQWLNLESDSGTIAVVIYGIGGSGKTTLGNAIYSSLKDKLQGWKHSRVTLIQNLKDPEVKDLQSLILQDLTGTKQDIRDFQTGGQILRDIIEKESVFLYIDNALHLEPLRKLLPKDVTNAKKFRLLVTARETNVSGIIESCGVESCKLYDVGSLPIDAALQVLCKQIDRKRDKDSILEEIPRVREIAKICSCCPLFLEVIGAYLHQRKNKVESYEQVLHWLEPGDEFGGTKKYNFDESRVLFSYNEFEPRAKEAFLDVCSFFSSWEWEWEEVACIVGEEEMTCLQEGALIKRENEEIKIHDLILLAGQNKSKDSRFRNAKDFSSALKNKELVSQVKGVWIEDCMKSPLFISAEELDAMSRSLRVFYLGSRARKFTILKGKCSKQFDELRFLHVESGVSNFPMNIFNLKNLRYLSINKLEEDVILSPSMNLPSLNVLKLNGSRIHGIAEIAHLRSLKQLDFERCNADGISECFPNLHDLQRLKVYYCEKLEELPESLVRLRSLQKLHLRGCRNLKQLPAGFGELVNLTELDLSFCSSLKELPCDLEKLTSLQSLNIRECSSLACLPHGLMSVWDPK